MSKRLQIDYIRVKKVQFGKKTELSEGVLTVNKEELINQAKVNCSEAWILSWLYQEKAAESWEFMT